MKGLEKNRKIRHLWSTIWAKCKRNGLTTIEISCNQCLVKQKKIPKEAKKKGLYTKSDNSVDDVTDIFILKLVPRKELIKFYNTLN